MIEADIQRHRQARSDQDAVNAERRRLYLPVAKILRDPALCAEVVDSAQVYVGMWRKRGLCSSHYIEAWEMLLRDPLKAADVLEEETHYAIQLRQNTPFVEVIRRGAGLCSSGAK